MNLPEVTFTLSPQVHPRGSPHAKILIVGEAPGKNEIEAGIPFVGASGQELVHMLTEAGIAESDCMFTNVINFRPADNLVANFFATSKKKAAEIGATSYCGKYALPIVFAGIKDLEQLINAVKPNVVVATGNIALWACTGELGILKWRGSEMQGQINETKFKCIPIVHPAAILRNWSWRWFTVVDLRRVRREASFPELQRPGYNFVIRPSFDSVVSRLQQLYDSVSEAPLKLAVDIETRTRHIACIGLAWTNRNAICIPLLCIEDDEGYWPKAEEVEIWWLLYCLLTHKNCEVIGQNFMYDNQYFVRRAGFACNLVDDTMMKMHVCFPGAKKGLDFISSVFCKYHRFWKEEGKDWALKMDEDVLWEYNCKDAVATYEANGFLNDLLDKFGLWPQYHERMRTGESAFKMMLRGIDVSITFKKQLFKDCLMAINQRKDFLMEILGFNMFGPKGGVSSKKMKMLCYDLFKLPPKYRIDPATKQRRLTCDKDAIDEWIQTCNIFYRPILKIVKDVRSLTIFKSTFAGAPLDWDDRFRCSMNVAGPHTFRWSTSEDAFGFGTNMQNIPKGDER